MAKIYGALEVAQLEWFTQSPDTRPSAASNTYRVIYASDVKQVQISDGTNWIAFINGSTNQTLAGNITFSGQQIFSGLHRLSVTTDSSSTGAITALNNTTPVIEFTAAVTSISGIANSASGATVMLVNRTGGTVAVLDEDTGATAANRIRTGTGAQISLANNASIILTYVGDSRWHIVGGSGSGSGSAGINYITNGSAEADTLGWSTYAESDAVTFQDAGDTVTLNNHGLSNGSQISFTSITSTTGISTNTLYYVISATTNTFQVATTATGSALPLTTNGSGTLVRFVPKTGSGGSSSLTIARNTTNPLIGTASFILTKGGSANLEGQGWEYDFTIDRGYQAKVLQISFQYLVNSGTFVAGTSSTVSDVTVYIYDVTNAQVIQPSSFKLLSNNASISDTFNATFQTASNSTSYRLIFHVSTPSTANYELKVDGISVSPSTYVYGTPVTDWVSYTPVMTVGSGALSNATPTGRWRRVGDSIEVTGKLVFSSTSSAFGSLVASLPSGLNIDLSKLGSGSQFVLGDVTALDATIANYVGGNVTVSSATSVSLLPAAINTHAGTAPVFSPQFSNTFPITFNTNDEISWEFKAPITGWSSSVQTSDQTDTRVVACRVGPSSSISIASGSTTAQYTGITTVFDTHGAFSGGTTYTVPVPGIYRISVRASFNATAGATQGQEIIRIYSGATLIGTLAHRDVIAAEAAGVTSYIAGANTFSFNAGEALTFRGYQDCSVTRNSCQLVELSIERLSGPSAIAASETVAASYWASSTVSTSTTAPINFDSKEYDTHNAVTIGANWRFIAPVSGIYQVSVVTNGSTNNAYLQIYKNNIRYKSVGIYNGTGATLNGGTTDLRLNAGEFIDVRSSAAITVQGGALDALSSTSNITVKRVGN